MPDLPVSPRTFERLQRVARPLVDTPDSVITRLLDVYESSAQAEPGVPRLISIPRQRAAPGQILPEGEYRIPILQALAERDGSAPAVDVIDRVGELLRERLTDDDYAELRTGGTRWKKRTQFARFNLVQEGLMDSPARGIWGITEAGRQHLAEHASK